jgi:hypothetical protein
VLFAGEAVRPWPLTEGTPEEPEEDPVDVDTPPPRRASD